MKHILRNNLQLVQHNARQNFQNFQFFKHMFFWWILRRELALRFENIKKNLTLKIAFRGPDLYYAASCGRFTDFRILQLGF